MAKIFKRVVLYSFLLLLFCAGIPQIVAAQAMRTETLQFDQDNPFSVKISIPSGWWATRERGTPIPGIPQTYDIKLMPPSGIKTAVTISIGRNQHSTPFTQQQFDSLVTTRVSSLLRYAVEKNPRYNEVELQGGYGRYCTLTDASLANRTNNIPNDEYLFLTFYFANYENGFTINAVVLADDVNSAFFQLILRSLSSIEVN